MSAATHKSLAAAFGAAALMALTGCQVSQDPAKAGFFDGITNLTNGTYNDRAAKQQADIDATNKLKADMAADIAANGKKTADLARQISAAQARADQITAQVAELKRQLVTDWARLAATQASAKQQQQLLEAQRRLDALDRQQSAIHGQIQQNQVPSDARMQQVEQEIAQMKDSVRSLAVVE